MLPAPNAKPLDVQVRDEDVEVLVDGDWCFGLLKELALFPEIGWTGWVTWWGPDGRHCARFAIDDIRRVDTTGPSRTPDS